MGSACSLRELPCAENLRVLTWRSPARAPKKNAERAEKSAASDAELNAPARTLRNGVFAARIRRRFVDSRRDPSVVARRSTKLWNESGSERVWRSLSINEARVERARSLSALRSLGDSRGRSRWSGVSSAFSRVVVLFLSVVVLYLVALSFVSRVWPRPYSLSVFLSLSTLEVRSSAKLTLAVDPSFKHSYCCCCRRRC